MKYLLENEHTNRLIFRKMSPDDFDAWLKFFEDPGLHQHWIGEHKRPADHCKEWYQRQRQRYDQDLGGMNALIEISSGKLIGHAGLLIQTVDGRQELEVAYSLLAEFRGKGYAIESARKCRDYAFENNFSDSLISIISLTNMPSIKVATKNSMVPEKEVTYNKNEVKIFRITKLQWQEVNGDEIFRNGYPKK